MKILVLEDNIERIKIFHQILEECNMDIKVFFVKKADECIDHLKYSFFDIVFLDHDLGPKEKNGSFVTSWIKNEKGKSKTTTFIIHSANPVGRDKMLNDLFENNLPMIIPFTITHFTERIKRLIKNAYINKKY